MKRYRIKPGSDVDLRTRDPDDTGDYHADDNGKAEARRDTEKLIARLRKLQERFFAGAERSLLIILQGMDTSGKDGTIKNVLSGVNPQGCQVVSFKAPTVEEQTHDFLWRVHRQAPARGYIGIFNRSHYEDALVTRVHGLVSPMAVRRRIERIREFEQLLHENGTTFIKFFLHISKDEQKERLEARIHDPEKRWKWNSRDLEERKYWKQYRKAYEDVIAATSTDNAPWYVVPANRKWYRDVVVARCVVGVLDDMKLKCPPGPPGVNWDRLKID